MTPWIRCGHVTPAEVTPCGPWGGFVTVKPEKTCRTEAKFIESGPHRADRPVCDAHADRFATLRYTAPEDVKRWGKP